MKAKLQDIIHNFNRFKVLVIGDAILDTYIKGTTERICREAPVPVINVQEKQHSCGGAANTAINLAALGAEVYFLSVTGKDESSRHLLDVLRKNGVRTEYIVRDPQRITLAKKRVTASSSILLRIDDGNTDTISHQTEGHLLEAIKYLYKKTDAVVLSDYGYGVITDEVITLLSKLVNRKSRPVIVDSKDLFRFRSLAPTAVKPNYEETIRLLGLAKLKDNGRVEQVRAYGKRLLELTGAKCVAATLDSDGTILFEKGKKPFRVHAVAQDNKKAIGAGDTFISALTLSLCGGASASYAVQVGSAAASIVLQKDGTVVCTGSDLKEYFSDTPKLINSLELLSSKVSELKKEGKKIVFTNGCFDILHKGHVSLLNKAKAVGDVLIVGINSDKSIRKLKGPSRPINKLNDRLLVLSGLQSVDYLVSFEEDTPVKIIKAIKPDVFVKGGDYTVDSIPESKIVMQLGGKVQIIPFVNNRSTTGIINRIKSSSGVAVRSL